LLAPLHSPAGFVCSMHFLGQKRPYDATGLYDPTFATAVCQSDDLTQLFPARCPMVSPEGPPGGLPNASRWFRQLRRRRPKGGQTSLRDIAAELAQRGIMNERGVPFSAASINAMLAHDPQARPFWCSVARRRRQPSQPRLASIIRPGRPAPTMGPGLNSPTATASAALRPRSLVRR
jgi:hypothetical protein